MSQSTRRIVFFTLIVVLLTVPAEIVLLKALAQPSQKEAIREWAQSLSPAELDVELQRVQSYPFFYRKEMMRAATPEVRARVFRAHLDAYLQLHPSLDANALALLRSLRAMLTPDRFNEPTEAQRTELLAVADQVRSAIGREDAIDLMDRLGPADGTFATFEPTVMYLTNKVRGWFVALAQMEGCDCNIERNDGCYDLGRSCSGGLTCAPTVTWPACAAYWSEKCNGLCVAGWGG